ncbi:DUF58 domain-containing protein [Uliginosibacterium sp. H3]|uniref:DUF58 domain-containing protein n=1 Tax=Uliginosibacterium silvisoli TaxID=3114758 RepID=A0ABU6K3Q2_9RHOO|nr:DUF58 domain-containing protein [Uliginosibacterium sp. H3]
MASESRTAPAIQPTDLGTVWVDAAWLARLEYSVSDLDMLPRQPRASVLAGRHASRMRGRGLDFEELRGYLPGDDVHHIDWRASQRVGKPLVRVYTEERDRPALFVVDQRMTMFFGSRRAMKSVIAAEVAALGMWMALRAGDRVGAVLFDDKGVEMVRPLRSRARAHATLASVARMNQSLHATSDVRPDHTQLDRALEAALRIAKHDYLVCVISDFAGASERTQQLLRALSAHNDVLAALVFDPLAKVEGWSSQKLVVTEGDLQAELNFGAQTVREPVEKFFSGRLANVAELLRRSGVPLMAFDTEGSSIEQLRHFLGHLPGAGARHG